MTTFNHCDQVQGGREGAGRLPLLRPQQGQLLRDRRKRLPLLFSRQGGKGERFMYTVLALLPLKAFTIIDLE